MRKVLRMARLFPVTLMRKLKEKGNEQETGLELQIYVARRCNLSHLHKGFDEKQ